MSQPEVIYKTQSGGGSVTQPSSGGFDAVALYDNRSDSPDELNFRKGDVLRVLEKDYNGVSGWWLCVFREKVGLAPGNRLELVESAPEKPQAFRRLDNSTDKINYDSQKTAYGVYDVPKIVYENKAPPPEKFQEIPDILKGQNIGSSLNQNRSNGKQTLYGGPVKPNQHEEMKAKSLARESSAINRNATDAFLWSDGLNSISNPEKQNAYVNSTLTGNDSSLTYKNVPELSNAYSIPRVSVYKVPPPPLNIPTYYNLHGCPTDGQNYNLDQQMPREKIDSQLILPNHTRRFISSDNDSQFLGNDSSGLTGNDYHQHRSEVHDDDVIVASTSSNINKNNKTNFNNKQNALYGDMPEISFRNKTLQCKSNRGSEGEKLTVKDDLHIRKSDRNSDDCGRKDRSLRRVRFADQVTSSDTEEWTKNDDKPPHNHYTLPLKPILTTANNQSKCDPSPSNSSGGSDTHDNYGNKNNTKFINNKQHGHELLDDTPDYENPYSEIDEQLIYNSHGDGYVPMKQMPVPSRGISSSQIGFPQKNYTSQFETMLNRRDAIDNSVSNNPSIYNQPHNVNLSNKNEATTSYTRLHQPQHKKIEGVFISAPTYDAPLEDDQEYQLCFVDLTKKDQEKAEKTSQLSPELLNKSREKIQILANSLDGILNRKNAEDATITSVILKSIDVELYFLIDIGGKAMKKSVETWSEDLIGSLLQHLEDLKTIQGTLAILNKQVLELSKDTNNVQSASSFETICSSCALSGRNICYPVHRFVDYLLPKFKLLFPSNFTDVGRLTASPVFNSSGIINNSNTLTKNPDRFANQNLPHGPVVYVAKSLPQTKTEQYSTMPVQKLSATVQGPIPKLEELSSYKASDDANRSRQFSDARPYEATPHIRLISSLQPGQDGSRPDDKNNINRSRSPQRFDLRVVNIKNFTPSQQLTIPQSSQSIQNRPLPPAPRPPSYTSVISQISPNLPSTGPARETTYPTANLKLQNISDTPQYHNYNHPNSTTNNGQYGNQQNYSHHVSSVP